MWIRSAIVTTMAAGAAVLAAGGTASAGGGCLHGTPPSDGDGAVVELVDACFTPTVLHVDPGTEVAFVNRDDTRHQVTGVGDTWGSFTDLYEGDRISYTFDEEGVYVYSCWLHPGMVGAVVAGSGTGSAGLDAASVSGGSVTVAADPMAPPGSAPSAVDDGNTMGALLIGGSVGLVLGGGAAAATIRRRRVAARIG
jgi:plastocyanin